MGTPSRIAAACAAALVLALSTGGVAGASPPALPGPSQPSIRPISPHPVKGYWQLHATPGEHFQLAAVVRNVGKTQATFQVLPVGAGTSSGTGVGYPLAGPTTSWLHVGTTSVSVAPGAGVVVHATLTVPVHLRPGQYVGGLEALGAAGAPSAKGRVQIAQRDASVVAWVVTVGRPSRDRIAWGRPYVTAAAGPALAYPARNAGQLIWAPKVQLALQAGTCGTRGKLLMTANRQWAATVPGTSWAYPVPLSAALGPGRYCASERAGEQPAQHEVFVVTPAQHHHEVSSPGAAHIRTAVVSSSFPVAIVAALGAIVGALLVLVLGLLLRRR